MFCFLKWSKRRSSEVRQSVEHRFEFNPIGPMTVSHAVQPTMMVQTGQPTTMTMNPMGSQLIQIPNGQLFLLPSNSYPVAQPEALQTLQVVQLVGTNNPGFTASPM